VKNSKDCLNFYTNKYDNNNLDRIFEIIKNENRQEKRRSDRQNGVGRDRLAENQRRQNVSVRRQKKNYIHAITGMLEIPCVFCRSYFSSGIEKIPDSDIDLKNELIPFGDLVLQKTYKGDIWICSNCKLVKSNLRNGEQLISSLEQLTVRDMEDITKTVGFVRYENEFCIESSFLPIIGTVEHVDQAVSSSTVEVESTAMVFDSMCELVLPDSVSIERVHFVANRGDIHPAVALDTMYRDTNGRMIFAKKRMENSIENLKMGFLVDNILHISEEQDNNLYNQYFLREIKGTKEYQKMLNDNNLLRRIQNGRNCISMDSVVFNGTLEQPALAKVLLTSEEIPVLRYETGDNIALVVPCYADGIPTCDVTTCSNAHQSALEKALELYPRGVIPPNKMLLVCKFIKQAVDIYLNKHLEKISTEHDLRLVFKRNSEVFLRGNLWIKDLEIHNLTGKTACIDDINHTVFHGSEFKLSVDPDDWEGEDAISADLLAHLGETEKVNLREGSLIEALFCNGRGLKMRWASQDVVKLDIRDEDLVTYD
jgi:hypothetical protein